MSLILLCIFSIINIIVLLKSIRQSMGIMKFSTLAALVNLSFILPQLIAIYTSNPHSDTYMTLALSFMCSCSLAVPLGFYIGTIGNKKLQPHTSFQINKLPKVITLFIFIGLIAYILNRGEYKGGKPSGIFVIINFFSGFLNYALILTLIGFYAKRKNFFTLSLIILTVIAIDQFILQARRASLIYFTLIIAYFYLSNATTSRSRIISYLIPILFFAGMVFNTVIGQYRLNAYGGQTNAIENLESLNFSESGRKIAEYSNGEVNRGIICINYVYANGTYDYGASNWNGIVSSLLPKSLFGSDFKKSWFIDSQNQKLVTLLTLEGSTLTGYYDSFASFGFFGFVKFLLISYIMGALWKRRSTSQISLFLYLALLTPALHLITHSSDNFINSLIIYSLFAYPFIKAISIRAYPLSLNNRLES